MLSLRNLNDKERVGYFKSYRAIGEWLARCGKTGQYYAIPSSIRNIAGIKLINVRVLEDGEREIEMEGSYY